MQDELEPAQTGRGLTIHPDSGDYLVADMPTHAGHAMRARHPEGDTVTLRIGLLPDHALLARLHPDAWMHDSATERLGGPYVPT